MDTDDLPQILSRETLQHNKTLLVIKMHIVKNSLEMLAEIAELIDDNMKSYEQFGKSMELGIHVDSTFRAKTADLLRLNT